MKTFKVLSPVDGTVYTERSFHTWEEIQNVLALSKTSQKSWKNVSIGKRAAYCNKAVDYLMQNAEKIAEEITWQMGRPIKYTPLEIKNGLRERADFMISAAEEALKDIEASTKSGSKRFIKREALGTVLVLAPWNYPFLTSVNAIIPALMAGNSVILKHALNTPLCAERYTEAFKAAELPVGVFQHIHSTHDQISKIIKSSAVDFVTFTGSVGGGRAIENALAGTFIPSGLELGGKDSAYVAADAHLNSAVENLVDGSFFNSGQSCCGVERIYVHESLFDDFVNDFVSLTMQYKLANPLDPKTTLGPMIHSRAKAFVQEQIDNALKEGAKGLIDNKKFAMHHTVSAYMAPQVLVNVNHTMDVMKEESFGPVVGIMPVTSDAEALKLMNDSVYGLTASIWTSDLERAQSIGNQLETGTVYMNRCDYLDPELAWTGIKNSGRGCTLSKMGYDSMTRPKSFHLKLT